MLTQWIDYAYDASSMITNRTTEGGGQTAEVSYEYDTLNRLVGESSLTNGTSLHDVRYSYDLAGNRLTKTVNAIGVAYTLGTGNRLASAGTAAIIDLNGTATEPIGTDDRWGELWVSNLTAQIGWVPKIDGSDFWIEDLPLELGTNQLVAAIRDQAGNTDYTTNTVYLSAASINMQYGYDAAGCMTNLNGISLDWDERYRLKSVDGASCSVAYEYDVLGRRVSRIEGSTTNLFVHEGNQVVADLDGSGNLLRTYVWGMGIDNLLSFTDHATSNTYYAIKDHQNSVIALVDAAGSVVENYEYDAYGNTKVFNAAGTELTASSPGNRYTFQGREIDWDTGLYHFRARWYDPETGRWLSKDPVGISGGLNLYAFCENNPVHFVDPDGLMASRSPKDCDPGREAAIAGILALDRTSSGGI
ncbi:MAG: RHS repeat-associated core domain-containing protein, partial [Deltaproteobacteria bacterium]|nr:RHS repeat-associated core domain-containing protein [Deltaproteobacteria bacterium]